MEHTFVTLMVGKGRLKFDVKKLDLCAVSDYFVDAFEDPNQSHGAQEDKIEHEEIESKIVKAY